MTLGMVPTTTATPDLTTLARDAVVRVRNVVCLATATAFFTIDGQVITNRHVIATSVKVQLSYWDGADSDGPSRPSRPRTTSHGSPRQPTGRRSSPWPPPIRGPANGYGLPAIPKATNYS
jgi:hypothetical protein